MFFKRYNLFKNIIKKFDKIIIIMMIVFISILFIGCSNNIGRGSSDGSVILNVVISKVLDYSLVPKSTDKDVQIPITPSSFLVELVDENGKTIQHQELLSVSVQPTITATFSVNPTGSYSVRVSAYDSNKAILGTSHESVQTSLGVNTIAISEIQAAEVYYESSAILPQSKSPAGLTSFLSFDQPGIHLQSYCFWGELLEDNGFASAYLGISQRMDENISGFGHFMFPAVASAVGYNNPPAKHVVLGGAYGLEGLNATVTQPWHYHVEIPNIPPTPLLINEVDMMLIEGTMGQKGARYEITSSTVDLEGYALETDIIVRDSMGIVNEGYGPASFFPQWLDSQQRTLVSDKYGGSVENYLLATQDAMTDQGSYYYSAPFLSVEFFSITRNGQLITHGHNGLIWMDIVYQAFDASALNIVQSANWSFFSIQLPDSGQALMVTNINNDVNGSLPVASLFTSSGSRTANNGISPLYRWNIQDIQINPVSGYMWTSPTSQLTYYTKYNIILSGSHSANLIVTLSWNDQELNFSTKIFYEGLANVTGVLDGEQVQGLAWLEQQPAGHL